MRLLNDLKASLLHLAFPHVCAGCGTDALAGNTPLCAACLHRLPQTHFAAHADNPLEKTFWGRLPVSSATATYYFTKASLMQRLMHQFKYRGNKELGRLLGRQMGMDILKSARFGAADALVPLPLFAAKERQRGFNQASILCEGISEVTKWPVLEYAVVRNAATESQTRKSRAARWQNIEGRFDVADAAAFANKHVLLVDDVITTGATLEACGRAIVNVPGSRLSIATLCAALD